MDDIFLENEKMTTRQITSVNWITCFLGYLLVFLCKVFGFARITYSSLFYCFFSTISILVLAEILYYFLVKKRNGNISLKYYTVIMTCLSLSFILIAERNPYILGVFFYGLIAAALYYDAILFLFALGLTILLFSTLLFNNILDINYKVNSITFFVDISRSSLISIMLLAMYLRKSKRIIKTLKAQEQEFSLLNQLLESKVEERTRQLKQTNQELQEQQEQLTILNKTLKESNEKIEKAYSELENTQSRLAQQEKMASIGLLVAGVAHEINNPIASINNNVHNYKLLMSKYEENPSDNEQMKEIVANFHSLNNINSMACERVIKIVKSLRSFARLDEEEYAETDVNSSIEDTLTLLNHKLKNKIDLIKEFDDIPIIKCYSNQLNQVFMNLLANAIDAIPEKGTIWINTFFKDDKLFIKIKDSGTGIKSENLKKIFDPGFTTKGVGVGTGLGLSIVYNIIETHKGNISVTSEPGKGTEFVIELPLSLD